MRVGEILMLGFKGPMLPTWLIDFEKTYGLGGVILFDYCCQKKTYENNIESPTQVKQLCTAISKLPSKPLVFIDQEGGKVRRLKEKLGFAPLPSQKVFNTLKEHEQRNFLQKSFSEMRELGIHFDLAPVVDLDLNPLNPNIGAVERSYSANPEDVRRNVAVVNDEAKKARLGLCLKHFPGLGGAKVDSHLELTDISETINEKEMELFFELAPTLSGDAVLLSHGVVRQWDDKNPVSMSPSAVQKLRQRLPETLLITDDIQMEGLQKHYPTKEACLQGIRAGVDIVLLGNNMLGEEKNLFEIAATMQKEIEKNPTLGKHFQESVQRVTKRKKQFC